MAENDGRLASPELPSGVDFEKLREAVIASGYPLQTVVALDLADDFGVVEEWGYVDRSSGEHRSLDLFAHKPVTPTTERLNLGLTLLIECKRSELPYVLFKAGIPRTPVDFPVIVGFQNRGFVVTSRNRSREVSPAEFLRAAEFDFIAHGPPIASSFGRAERKGKDLVLSGSMPYNNIVLPLASALDHYREGWSRVREQEWYSPTVALCVSVVDAPLVVASGTPESPSLYTDAWVRVVRQEAVKERDRWRRHHYVIDVVHRTAFGDYVRKEVIPFVETLASRMVDAEETVLSHKGSVDDFEKWTWAEMRRTGERSS